VRCNRTCTTFPKVWAPFDLDAPQAPNTAMHTSKHRVHITGFFSPNLVVCDYLLGTNTRPPCLRWVPKSGHLTIIRLCLPSGCRVSVSCDEAGSPIEASGNRRWRPACDPPAKPAGRGPAWVPINGARGRRGYSAHPQPAPATRRLVAWFPGLSWEVLPGALAG
jgi:hypothetical protein